MLEYCGRWLYRNPETFIRCTKFLERMMALKQTKVNRRERRREHLVLMLICAQFMDGNLSTLVESAYLTVSSISLCAPLRS